MNSRERHPGSVYATWDYGQWSSCDLLGVAGRQIAPAASGENNDAIRIAKQQTLERFSQSKQLAIPRPDPGIGIYFGQQPPNVEKQTRTSQYFQKQSHYAGDMRSGMKQVDLLPPRQP